MESTVKAKRVGRYENKVNVLVPMYVIQKEELERIAAKIGRSQCSLVRDAINAYITELQKAGV